MSGTVQVYDEMTEVLEKAKELESKIQVSMRSLVDQFKEQADSLTFEGVQRLIEKELSLETHALDAHKGFIKQCLSECLDGVDSPIVQKITEELPTVEKEDEAKKDLKERNFDKDMEDSPVLGLIKQERAKLDSGRSENVKTKTTPTKDMIREFLMKRASYIKENPEKITMAGVRRFLEEDMGLAKRDLDPYKEYIAGQVDRILQMEELPLPVAKEKSHSADSASISGKMTSDSSKDGSNEVEEELKLKRKRGHKEKMHSEQPNKRKALPKEPKMPMKKHKSSKPKPLVEDDVSASDEDVTPASKQKQMKAPRETQVSYGKRVEHLKSLIKLCGMSVSPAVYKRVKQASEDKKEAFMIKELEGILSREGLSANPSEKEIKEVKRRKQREKELEGIDQSNIVSSTRRRAATSFIVTPIPEIPVESDEGEGSEDSGRSDDEDDNDGEDDANDEVEDGNENSQSEESGNENGVE